MLTQSLILLATIVISLTPLVNYLDRHHRDYWKIACFHPGRYDTGIWYLYTGTEYTAGYTGNKSLNDVPTPPALGGATFHPVGNARYFITVHTRRNWFCVYFKCVDWTGMTIVVRETINFDHKKQRDRKKVIWNKKKEGYKLPCRAASPEDQQLKKKEKEKGKKRRGERISIMGLSRIPV